MPHICFRFTARSKRIILILTIVGLFIVGVMLAVYQQDNKPEWLRAYQFISDLYVKNYTEDVADINKYQNEANHIRIISWTQKFWSHKGPWFPEGRAAFTNCPLPRGATCEYAHNKSMYAVSDAVLFKGNIIQPRDMPLSRRANQTWIFCESETLQHKPGANWRPLAKLFNATCSYSTTSDIVNPYGSCSKKSPDDEIPTVLTNYAITKSELVSWIVSNCHAPSNRNEYVAELQQHIPVHIYGRCGPYKCEPRMSAECDDKLLRKTYKFYLAFENSFCRQYITEKFWKCFEYDIVPIVYGSSAYENFAPPHSFIDVRDFRSPKHLADYLLVLNQNDALYNEYFAWKNTYKCGRRNSSQLPCQICQLLHKRKQSKLPPSPLNVTNIWSGDARCEDVDTFRKKCNCWPKT